MASEARTPGLRREPFNPLHLVRVRGLNAVVGGLPLRPLNRSRKPPTPAHPASSILCSGALNGLTDVCMIRR